jgi:hypothetical protein
MKEVRLGAGELESDLSALSAVVCELSCLGEVCEGCILTRKQLSTAQLEQQRRPLHSRCGLGERPHEQLRRGLRRAAVDRGDGGFTETCYDPSVSGGLHGQEMGTHPARRCAIVVEEAGCGPMRAVSLVAGQRGLHRVAHDRMQETRRGVGAEDLQLYQGRGQVRAGLEPQPRQGRRMAQLAAVSEHRQCLGQT